MAELFDILTYDYAKTNSVDDPNLLNLPYTSSIDHTPNTGTFYNVVSTTTGVVAPAGVYNFAFSIFWQISDISQQWGLFSFSLDGGTTWDTVAKESKDPSNRETILYGFPKEIVAPAILTLDLQCAHYEATDTGKVMQVTFADVWIERVK